MLHLFFQGFLNFVFLKNAYFKHINMKQNKNISVKQKPDRNRDQQCVVRIKYHDLLQIKLRLCVYHW